MERGVTASQALRLQETISDGNLLKTTAPLTRDTLQSTTQRGRKTQGNHRLW